MSSSSLGINEAVYHLRAAKEWLGKLKNSLPELSASDMEAAAAVMRTYLEASEERLSSAEQLLSQLAKQADQR